MTRHRLAQAAAVVVSMAVLASPTFAQVASKDTAHAAVGTKPHAPLFEQVSDGEVVPSTSGYSLALERRADDTTAKAIAALSARVDSLRDVVRALTVPRHVTDPGTAEAIAADRPGFVETTTMLRRGQLQIETSASVDLLGAASHVVSEPSLLRLGVSDRFELRFRQSGFFSSTDPVSASGMSDVSLGAAWKVRDGSDSLPDIALVTYWDIPSGSPALRSTAVTPSFFLPFSWSPTPSTGLSVMSGVTVVRDAGTSVGIGSLAASVSHSLSDRVATFAELAGESLAAASEGGSTITLGAGASLRVGLRHQLDVGASRGLSAAAPKARVFIGWSSRLRD